MVAMPHQSPASSERKGFPALALFATLGAALAFGGVAAVTRALGGNPVGMVAGAIVMALAGSLLLVPAGRPGALLLAWNGLGIAVGMFVVGIFSVGALMAFPLTLAGIALSSWPRRPRESAITPAAIVVHVGGFLLVALLYGPGEDVAGLVGIR